MRILKTLWLDDLGAVVSAEAVVVGSVAITGLTVGLNAVATAVNDELEDVAMSLRGLDQSYCIPPRSGCGAMTAGSQFIQATGSRDGRDGQQSTAESVEIERVEKSQPHRLNEQLLKQRSQSAQPE